MKRKTWPSSRASIRRHIFAGVVIVAFLAVGVGGWASTAEISGALIAQGSLVVDSNVKKVQHPTGGVVGELRVRDGDRVRVDPKDIDQVKLGQRVVIRFSAFNQRTTPELNGTVARVAADTTNDQRTEQSYYIVRISMTAEEIERLGDTVKLAPGMPVEAFIQTGDRTMMSYFIKPLHDQLMRSFREK